LAFGANFISSWIRIRIWNPDPDPGDKFNADPDTDPDPKHWSQHCVCVHCKIVRILLKDKKKYLQSSCEAVKYVQYIVHMSVFDIFLCSVHFQRYHDFLSYNIDQIVEMVCKCSLQKIPSSFFCSPIVGFYVTSNFHNYTVF
jgi:hypothetical protein